MCSEPGAAGAQQPNVVGIPTSPRDPMARPSPTVTTWWGNSYRERHDHRQGHIADRRDLGWASQHRGRLWPHAPGLAAWSKAGVIVAASTRQGAPYAAVMATAGHGVRFQYDYTHDAAGLAGAVSTASPRWLRLTRSGDELTAYDSATGRTWRTMGSTTLGGLPRALDIGLFVTSPVTYGGLATMATASFDDVALRGTTTNQGWHGQGIGQALTVSTRCSARAATTAPAGAFVVGGSGDIAAAVTASGDHTCEHPDPGTDRCTDRDRGGGGDVHHQRVPSRLDPHDACSDPRRGHMLAAKRW